MIKLKKERTAGKKESKQTLAGKAKPAKTKEAISAKSKIKKADGKPARSKAALKPKKPAAPKVKKITVSKPKPLKEKEKIIPAFKPAENIVTPAPVVKPKPQVQKEIKEPKKAAPEPALEIEQAQAPKAAEARPVPSTIEAAPVAEAEVKELELEFPITVKDLAVRLQEKSSIVIKNLMSIGVMAGINQALEEDVVKRLCEKYNLKIKKAPEKEELILEAHKAEDASASLESRPPIVTLMGHVDHGKTSLLDAIRKTKVAESEHGGITQHIGAYRVALPHGEITFLDTPGHEAFTAMRSRGAKITDIVVLVVAADDGVMPQTQEAIDHARAAGVPIIIAINKIDKPQANPDMVKKQLSELDLKAEDWGGKTITVPVSAKTGTGIDDLLEMILLEAQMLELKANPNRLARGVVIEAKMSKGRGPVATLLIENGTLRLNENIIVGRHYGKIRAMFDDRGASVTAVGPSMPVEVVGISEIPAAGEEFFVIEDEKKAKELAALRMEHERQKQVKAPKRINLEELHEQIKQGRIKELKLIIKSDVQGSLEAIKDTLNKLNVSEIKLNIIHTGTGNINTSDVVLAVASEALILGFNVSGDERAKELMAKEGVEIRTYNIIYELANDIKAAIEGMLEPRIRKVSIGRAEIRKVFKLTRSGTVAGCFVTKGKINRAALINIVRNGEIVFEGKLSALKRFKDDVRDVAEGFECGMSFAGFDGLQEGDVIEAYDIEKIARKL